ncbi:MAG: hypothetical protein OEO77_04995 [Acidimicrobiia bacterium]|nr:hypothetical protein [Acidimicrobiia bacterium]
MQFSAQQRADITELVDRYVHESPEYRLPEPGPAKSKGKSSSPKARDITWYVVIDEIIELRVTAEAWPWPQVDPDTRFLSFDLSKTKRFTVDGPDLHRVVSEKRKGADDPEVTERSLRIGDVFEVRAERIQDPSTWKSVQDHTEKKRKEAQAAMHAMATPPHLEGIDKLEDLGRQLSGGDRAAVDVTPTQAFPAV